LIKEHSLLKVSFVCGQALFKKASAAKAPKQAAKAVKKAAVKMTGTKTTRGWLGGAGGAQGLDKWYGEYAAAAVAPCCASELLVGQQRSEPAAPDLHWRRHLLWKTFN
jgi:hypothetical protein